MLMCAAVISSGVRCPRDAPADSCLFLPQRPPRPMAPPPLPRSEDLCRSVSCPRVRLRFRALAGKDGCALCREAELVRDCKREKKKKGKGKKATEKDGTQRDTPQPSHSRLLAVLGLFTLLPSPNLSPVSSPFLFSPLALPGAQQLLRGLGVCQWPVSGTAFS